MNSEKKKSFWQTIERPIKVLAPMAGYTDSAFRLLCREYGADVVMTELISADAVAYAAKLKVESRKLKVEDKTFNFNRVSAGKNHSTAELLSFFEAERPLLVQLFGKFPEKFAMAAKWITEELKPDGIDINMGCPARKVVGSDHGAALLKNHDLALEIIRAVKENTNLPVSVKTRLGWSDDDEILEFGPKIVEAGAEAIILHGRTYKDGFKGEARWENIYELKQILGDKAVVIGNGDLFQVKSEKSKVKSDGEHSVLGSDLLATNYQLPTTSLDGYAIGRAAVGKPWIFRQDTGDNLQITELKKMILRHAELAYESKEDKGILEFRKHLLGYLKGLSNAKELRLEAVKIENISDIKMIIEKI